MKIRYWKLPNGTCCVRSEDGSFAMDFESIVPLERLRQNMTDAEWVEGQGEPPKIGWVVREYSGGEVYRVVNGEAVEAPIKERGGLVVGDEIVCPSLFGYFKATVGAMDDGSLYAHSGEQIGFLEFDQDDRHCWTCSGTGNLKAIQRLDLSSGG